MDFFNIAKKVVSSGGELISKGVSTVTEDSKMLDEINRINSKCKAIIEEFNQMKQDFDRDFEREHSEYISLADKINKQLETFDALSKFLSDVNDKPKEFIENNIKNVTTDIETKIEVGGKQSLITGGIAGIATGAGTVELVTMFGTAGTGAALSSLTGTAYVHATLAALDGGTLSKLIFLQHKISRGKGFPFFPSMFPSRFSPATFGVTTTIIKKSGKEGNVEMFFYNFYS